MQQPTADLIPTADPLTLTFNVSEVFYSVQGEGTRAGRPCTFIRLQGCTLRCVWCDTSYALDHRTQQSIMTGAEILQRIEEIGCTFVEFTGGEPLEQFAVFPLMSLLCDRGFEVAVETGGHVDLQLVDPRVIKIVDVKCPDSKMVTLNKLENLRSLQAHDEVKFVLSSRRDYDYAVDVIREYDLTHRCAAVLISCVFGTIEFRTVVEWILEDKLNVRFQLQQHKFIWEPDRRGV